MKDRYNEIQDVIREVFILAITAEGAVNYIYYRICFYFTKDNFYFCYLYNSLKVLESPGILSEDREKYWDCDAKSPGKSEKTS